MNLIAHQLLASLHREAAGRRISRRLRRERAARRLEADAVTLPYPHSRNDCQVCRERDADMIIKYPGQGRNGGPTRCCTDCAGRMLADLIGRGMTAAARPIEASRRR